MEASVYPDGLPELHLYTDAQGQHYVKTDEFVRIWQVFTDGMLRWAEGDHKGVSVRTYSGRSMQIRIPTEDGGRWEYHVSASKLRPDAELPKAEDLPVRKVCRRCEREKNLRTCSGHYYKGRCDFCGGGDAGTYVGRLAIVANCAKP